MKKIFIQKRILLFLFCFLSFLICEAQERCCRLATASNITKYYLNDKKEVEIAPYAVYNFNMSYNSNGLTIFSPQTGKISMSNEFEYSEKTSESNPDLVMYMLIDRKNNNKIISYTKSKKCSFENPLASNFIISDDKDFLWHIPFGFTLYFDCNNQTKIADQNLQVISPEEDLLVKFMKFIGKKGKNASTPYSYQKPTQSTPTQPQYGEIKLTGYNYEWSDWYGKAYEKENSPLTIETRKDHYVGVEHRNNVTNLTPDRKSKTKWSTNKQAFYINLPKGVKIENNDDIICWELNGTSSDPKYSVQILFIYSPSTGRIQCLRNTRRSHSDRILNDIYYFSTYDSAAWSQIKARLMQELPYCATRIY